MKIKNPVVAAARVVSTIPDLLVQVELGPLLNMAHSSQTGKDVSKGLLTLAAVQALPAVAVVMVVDLTVSVARNQLKKVKGWLSKSNKKIVRQEGETPEEFAFREVVT